MDEDADDEHLAVIVDYYRFRDRYPDHSAWRAAPQKASATVTARDVAAFLAGAVASGVTGNFAYDLLKNGLRRAVTRFGSAGPNTPETVVHHLARVAVIEQCARSGLAVPRHEDIKVGRSERRRFYDRHAGAGAGDTIILTDPTTGTLAWVTIGWSGVGGVEVSATVNQTASNPAAGSIVRSIAREDAREPDSMQQRLLDEIRERRSAHEIEDDDGDDLPDFMRD